jgi:hypothetical protein
MTALRTGRSYQWKAECICPLSAVIWSVEGVPDTRSCAHLKPQITSIYLEVLVAIICTVSHMKVSISDGCYQHGRASEPGDYVEVPRAVGKG